MEEQTFIRQNNNNKKIKGRTVSKKLHNKYLYNIIILCVISLIILLTLFIKNSNAKYKNYINECKQLKRFNITKIINNNPYLSICIPVYNMGKFIERAILSIINQSFQDFEIIIVNDNSNDNSYSLMEKLQIEDSRIKIINHNKNLGVYASRADACLSAKGKYILLMDPDDMLLNQELFEQLYNYNLKLNLDIIEFTVIYQDNEKKTIYKPKEHYFNHYHNFDREIIYQPELSNIIFYDPKTNKIQDIFCRTIWNKLIRKNVVLKSIDYIDIDFKNKFLITADDTPINVIINQYANNYSNINLPGYLYNCRRKSMSRGNNGRKHDIIVSTNYLLFYKLFFRYIIDYNKDMDYLYYDMKESISHLIKIKEYKMDSYMGELNSLLNKMADNKNTTFKFKIVLYRILDYLNDDKNHDTNFFS